MAKIMTNSKWFPTLNEEDVTYDGIIDFVKAHESVREGGRNHRPILHSELLKQFRDRANSLGITLCDTKVGLSKDGMKIMVVSNSLADKNSEYGLSCGWRNSTNSTQAFAGCFGTNCWICANGCINGLVKPSCQRNTIHNYDHFGDKMSVLFEKFESNKENINKQIAVMKSNVLTDDIIGKFVKKMIGSGEMGNKHICDIVRDIMDDVENPSLNSHNDNSCFRLLNSCTKVCTHDIANPIMGSNLSRLCNNTIMSIISDEFTPLGDDVKEDDVIEV